MYLKITKPKITGKKLTAIFYDDEKIPIKTVHFGAHGYDDYTVPPHDDDKKARYIKRHKVRENWDDPTTAGTLSRYILWSNKSITDAINNYYTRFILKILYCSVLFNSNPFL